LYFLDFLVLKQLTKINNIGFFNVREQKTELVELIRKGYKVSYDCALKIKKIISQKYGYNLQEDEMSYLTIHIERVVKKSGN